NGGQPSTTSLTINAGEVKQLNNTVGGLFGLSNIGGAIHVTTATPVPFVISGRTYNLTPNGTFGQLTTAVTAADAIGKGDRPLHIVDGDGKISAYGSVIDQVTQDPTYVPAQQ